MSTESLVNEYVSMRNKRLVAQRQLDADYQKELALRDQILAALQPSGTTHHFPGFLVQIETTVEPFIKNFDELAAYVKQHDALDLLQKRLTPNAVKLRWQAGETIPGVGQSTKLDLTVTQE